MATLHLFFYVFLSVFELGGVAVSASFAENKNYKKKKKNCSVSKFTNISGTVKLNNAPWNLLYPLKRRIHFICKHALNTNHGTVWFLFFFFPVGFTNYECTSCTSKLSIKVINICTEVLAYLLDSRRTDESGTAKGGIYRDLI